MKFEINRKNLIIYIIDLVIYKFNNYKNLMNKENIN